MPLSAGELRGQGVEQFGRSAALFSGLHSHLSFLDHVHELNPNECVLGCLERFKPQHGPCHPLYTSMILLHNVVEILDLADFDGGAMLGIVALDGGCIGRTPVDGDLLRHAVAADRLGQEAFRGLLVALLREQKINRLALLIPTVSPAKNSLVYFISIAYIDYPVWRSHREEAKRGVAL